MNIKKIKYYYGVETGIILISLKNNCLITAMSAPADAANRAEKIIDIMKSDSYTVYLPENNTALHINAKKKGNSLSRFLPIKFSAENIEQIEMNLFPDPENENLTDIKGFVIIANEKMAVVFSSVIRLFLTDYYRKEGIADLKTMLEKKQHKL